MRDSYFAEIVGSRFVRTFTRPLRRNRVSIFMLHRASSVHSGVVGHDLSRLAASLDWLKGRGFNFVSLRQILDSLDAGTEVEEDAVAFTIDDGYADQGELIAPVFLERGIPLTLFVITGLIDRALWPWDSKVAWLVRNSRCDRIELRLRNARFVFDRHGGANERRVASQLKAICSGLDDGQLQQRVAES